MQRKQQQQAQQKQQQQLAKERRKAFEEAKGLLEAESVRRPAGMAPYDAQLELLQRMSSIYALPPHAAAVITAKKPPPAKPPLALQPPARASSSPRRRAPSSRSPLNQPPPPPPWSGCAQPSPRAASASPRVPEPGPDARKLPKRTAAASPRVPEPGPDAQKLPKRKPWDDRPLSAAASPPSKTTKLATRSPRVPVPLSVRSQLPASRAGGSGGAEGRRAQSASPRLFKPPPSQLLLPPVPSSFGPQPRIVGTGNRMTAEEALELLQARDPAAAAKVLEGRAAATQRVARRRTTDRDAAAHRAEETREQQNAELQLDQARYNALFGPLLGPAVVGCLSPTKKWKPKAGGVIAPFPTGATATPTLGARVVADSAGRAPT